MTDLFLIEKYRNMSPTEVRDQINYLHEQKQNQHIKRKLFPEDIELIDMEIGYASRVLAQLRKADDGHPCDS